MLVLAGALAAILLFRVLATVFFSITVAYLLLPLDRRLRDHGLSRRWASLVTALAAFAGTIAVFAPLAVVLVLRLDSLLELLSAIPDVLSVEVLGETYVLTLEQAQAIVQSLATNLARSAASALPVLAVKFTLFGFLVFGLLYHEDRAHRAVLAVVPPAYRGVANAFDDRTRETLFAIYVLQAATAVGTFLLALPVFTLLGYRFPITLATVAAVLQFIPVVGPSFLLAGLALFALIVGDTLQATLVLLAGGFFVAWLPDVLIRPRLARETAHLPGTLYFVGFLGGLLTLGPVGIIAGPLVIALVVEAADQLSNEMNVVRVDEE